MYFHSDNWLAVTVAHHVQQSRYFIQMSYSCTNILSIDLIGGAFQIYGTLVLCTKSKYDQYPTLSPMFTAEVKNPGAREWKSVHVFSLPRMLTPRSSQNRLKSSILINFSWCANWLGWHSDWISTFWPLDNKPLVYRHLDLHHLDIHCHWDSLFSCPITAQIKIANPCQHADFLLQSANGVKVSLT